MFNFFKKDKKDNEKKVIENDNKKHKEFFSPLSGVLINLENVPDEVFSKKILGQGFAIEPTQGIVCAPVDGKIVQVFDTKHAISSISNEGDEILIHFGIDTVNLNGEGFNCFVKNNDEIKVGQKLLEVDLNFVKSKVPSIITPIIFTNIETDILIEKRDIKIGDKINF